MKTEYDAPGRKTADIDPMNRRTEYQYDVLGRLTHVILAADTPSATITSYTYDARGNKLTQTDAEGRTTRWEYDSVGRETARVLPNTERETKAYNTLGELNESTDFNGETTKYVYDVMGRLKTLDYPQDADVTFGYDATGKRISAIDGRGESTSTYDAQGRIVRSYDADGFAIEYTYDTAGNMLTRVSASQSLVYGYDERDRMVTVTRTIDGEAPSVTRYEYDQDGNRKAMIGGDGTRTEYGYDSRNRLRELIKKTAAGALLVAMTYNVDAGGMRTAVTESDPQGIIRTVAWGYDALKRLTREAIDHRDDAHDRTSNWTYDKVGNRLTQAVTVGAASAATTTAYSYDVNDRLLTEVANGVQTRYTYDDNGNTLTKTIGADVVEYAYDDADRLVEMRKMGERVGYVYNANGLRARQIVAPVTGATTTTYYVQDKAYPYAQVIEEWTQQGNGAKALNATYTFADELVSQTHYSTTGSTVTSYVQADGLSSTRWLTGATGTITDLVEYDAFGDTTRRDGLTRVEHLFRGEAFDSHLGLYYLRARFMDPRAGRFLNADRFIGVAREPHSLHKYLYVHNDPVNQSDPSGFSPLMEQTSVAPNVLGNLLRISSGTIRTYNKVEGIVSFLQNVVQIMHALRNPQVFAEAEAYYRGARKDIYFSWLMRDGLDAAADSFERNLGRLSTTILALEAGELMNSITSSSKDAGYIVYLPSPPKGFATGTVRFPTSSVNVGGKRRKVWAQFGGNAKQGGRVVGLGWGANPGNQGKPSHQFFRQDWDITHGHWGVDTDRAWTDKQNPQFHFHVGKD